MNIDKKVIGTLEKCYSLAKLSYQQKEHFLVAAEKTNACILYNLEGNQEETIWEGPGGVMSMVQVPGTNGQFLATQRFYSPNDSKEASIVIATPKGKDDWEIRTLTELPFVHRFDIVSKNGVNFLIACTIKSGHEYKDDWSSAGKVYGAVLPQDLSGFHHGNQLSLQILKEGMLKNHGYFKYTKGDSIGSVISCEQGIFFFEAPDRAEEKWKITKLLDVPASDAVLLDMDEDGEDELIVLSPFHGDTFQIYKKINGVFKNIYSYQEKLPFLHAIFGGKVMGKPTVIVGNREGKKELLLITSDGLGGFSSIAIDRGCGPANIHYFENREQGVLIAANREINEIAMYTFQWPKLHI